MLSKVFKDYVLDCLSKKVSNEQKMSLEHFIKQKVKGKKCD
jgi:hypothetical protein